MTEPDVAMTDFALALQSGAFAVWLTRRRGQGGELAKWFVVYFASAAVASLCGGLVHGFFLDTASMGRRVLWPATLLAVGLNAVAAWLIGAELLFGGSIRSRIRALTWLAFFIYAALVMLGVQRFGVAVWMAAPATLFLFVALALTYARGRARGALLAAGGLVVSLFAMLVQQLGIGLDPTYLGHNALAHVVQAVALALIFAGAMALTRPVGG